MSDATTDATTEPAATPREGPDDPLHGELVDFAATARRVRRSAVVVGVAVVAGWLVIGFATGGPTGSGLAAAVGLGLAVMFLVELVVVGGSALRGMLRAGERGERLASGDVSIVPPQLQRRRGGGS